LILYLICGIGGNIFSLTVDTGSYFDTYKAGASTALYGSIGIILGYLIINWTGLQAIGEQLRYQIVCVFLFLLIFVLIFTPNSGNVDFYGHLGGFLTGIWVTGFTQSLIFEIREKIISRVFIGLFLIQFIVTFVIFFVTNTSK
jgi:membrane associated rhomboid family serine protease